MFGMFVCTVWLGCVDDGLFDLCGGSCLCELNSVCLRLGCLIRLFCFSCLLYVWRLDLVVWGWYKTVIVLLAVNYCTLVYVGLFYVGCLQGLLGCFSFRCGLFNGFLIVDCDVLLLDS